MIEANELRIGNMVSYNDKLLNENHIVKLTCIGVGDRCGAIPQVWYENDEVVGSTHDFKDIYPIPLTEEILLKCGFEEYKKNEESYYKKGECFELHQFNQWGHFSYECGDNLVGNFVCTRFDCLHQLQNLYFVLTGKELEVKL